MGTTYHITLEDQDNKISKTVLDSLLIAINLSLSTYIDTSTISKINQAEKYGSELTLLVGSEYATNEKIVLVKDKHFIANYEKASEIFRNTDGFFDPTVMGLVNYWGFGYDPKVPVTKVDSAEIEGLLEKVGMEKFNLQYNENEMIIIKPQEAALDFSALAKGYGVDQLAELVSKAGIKNFLIEIGGEAFAQGFNSESQKWKIGLNTPKEDAALTDFSGIIYLDNKGLASSGNYRIFHEVNGKKYGHELNPKSGYPEKNEVLGVSVIAPTCMEADAAATACMIMGLEYAYKYITDYQHLEACFFISDEVGNIISRPTPGFAEYLKK